MKLVSKTLTSVAAFAIVSSASAAQAAPSLQTPAVEITTENYVKKAAGTAAAEKPAKVTFKCCKTQRA